MSRPLPRLIIVQHHPLETAGHISAWAASMGLSLHQVTAWQAELPKLESLDAVLLLGGPYSVHDAQNLAWLRAEKEWLANAIANEHSVFGICMGAQLLAQALGAQVLPWQHVQNQQVRSLPSAELGWVECAIADDFSSLLGRTRRVLQWHSESFTLPTGAMLLGSSEQCTQQGFRMQRGAQALMGVQFHPEWDTDLLRGLILELALPHEQLALTSALDEHVAFAAQRALTECLLGSWVTQSGVF